MTVGPEIEFGSVFREANEFGSGELKKLPEALEKITAVELSSKDEFSSQKIAITTKIITFLI